MPPRSGELAALLSLVDALVAGESEVFGEAVDSRLVARRDAERRRARLRRRHPFGERRRGCADEASRREHVERPRPLADEVRWRLEPGAPAHSAAGQERDVLVAEEPARGLGCVARIGVLGREHDERPPELLVDRASKSGNAGSETRARVSGSASRNARKRSLSASSRTNGWRTGRSMTSDGTGVPRASSYPGGLGSWWAPLRAMSRSACPRPGPTVARP